MQRRFQQFVLLTIFLTIIVELFAWFYVPADSWHSSMLDMDGFGAVLESGPIVYWLILVARLLLLLGLYSFQPWARTSFLLFTVALVLSTLLWGYRVAAPIEGPFLYLETLMDGVILALAYYSSASSAFRKGAN